MSSSFHFALADFSTRLQMMASYPMVVFTSTSRECGFTSEITIVLISILLVE